MKPFVYFEAPWQFPDGFISSELFLVSLVRILLSSTSLCGLPCLSCSTSACMTRLRHNSLFLSGRDIWQKETSGLGVPRTLLHRPFCRPATPHGIQSSLLSQALLASVPWMILMQPPLYGRPWAPFKNQERPWRFSRGLGMTLFAA